MAVAWRSIASTTYSTGNTGITLNKPAGTVNDDILIAAIMSNGDWDPGFTIPSGWTEYTGIAIITWGAPGTGRFRVFWKRASSEGASWTWSWTGALGTSGAVSAYSGAVASGDPNDVAPSSAFGHDGAPTAPSITTATDSSLLIMIGNTWNGGSTWTEPSSPEAFTQRGDPASSLTMGMADATRTSHGAGGAVASLSPTDYWVVALLALKPAVVAPLLTIGTSLAKVTAAINTIEPYTTNSPRLNANFEHFWGGR